MKNETYNHPGQPASLIDRADSKSVARKFVSVVIPCFNEGEGIDNLASVLKEFQATEEDRFEFEFVFVDDGSEDRTWELIQDHFTGWGNCLFCRHEENIGLMAAILTGAKAATHEIVCSMDSDCTYHPDQLPALIELLKDDVALVTSSPYHPQGKVENLPYWRLALSRFASSLYRVILRNKLYCYTSCFRAFRKSVIQNVELKNSGFVGTSELLWRIEQQGDWAVVEVPAVLRVRQFGQSKCRVARVTLMHLKLMSEIIVSKFTTRVVPAAVREPL